MGSVARLFFAVGVSPEVGAALGSLGSRLKGRAGTEGLRFVDVEKAHFTLRFLGEQGPERQAAAVRAGRLAATGVGAFELGFAALGVFPDQRRPHTLWIGAGQGADELVGLARRLSLRLANEGFADEERPFVPHLTLARVKRRPSGDAMRALLSAEAAAVSQRVESFTLMESTPDRGTVRYIALETFPLESPCTPSKSPSTAAPK
jgi:2'-5' RNA ligase